MAVLEYLKNFKIKITFNCTVQTKHRQACMSTTVTQSIFESFTLILALRCSDDLYIISVNVCTFCLVAGQFKEH